MSFDLLLLFCFALLVVNLYCRYLDTRETRMILRGDYDHLFRQSKYYVADEFEELITEDTAHKVIK